MMGTVEAGRQVQDVLEESGREIETAAMRQPVRIKRQRYPT